MAFRFLLVLVTFSIYAKAVLADPSQIYPDTHRFEIYRDGDLVGEHITDFRQDASQLTVSSNMNLDIKFLGLTFYSFSYLSKEIWTNDELNSLEVYIDDDGDITNVTAQKTDNGLSITTDNESYIHPTTLVTTNHWLASVIHSNAVLNTLTGNVNYVEILDGEWENIIIADGKILAKRYDYTGDLKDTSVWYDKEGRWVKLSFKARDGSDIEYLCQTCPVTQNSNG
ncbi:DUF6134 family protein [Curvivirga sp.]|uniref:DUF6134 family protein n=1 Tax=Curvivirga sp. TaxID=2856848 RepID=UPI003B5CAD32